MEYRRFGDTLAVRLDKGEEVFAKLVELCQQEDIRLASVKGIGATDSITLGAFDSEKFTYVFKEYTGDLEIINIDGNITTIDDEIHPHLHMTVGNPAKGVFAAGHASRARIVRTAEIFIHVYDGKIGREFSHEVGINLMSFLE